MKAPSRKWLEKAIALEGDYDLVVGGGSTVYRGPNAGTKEVASVVAKDVAQIVHPFPTDAGHSRRTRSSRFQAGPQRVKVVINGEVRYVRSEKKTSLRGRGFKKAAAAKT